MKQQHTECSSELLNFFQHNCAAHRAINENGYVNTPIKIIREYYRLGAERNNHTTLKHSISDYNIFELGCSEHNNTEEKIKLYIEYVCKYHHELNKDQLPYFANMPKPGINLFKSLDKDLSFTAVKYLVACRYIGLFHMAPQFKEIFAPKQILELGNIAFIEGQYELAQKIFGISNTELLVKHFEHMGNTGAHIGDILGKLNFAAILMSGMQKAEIEKFLAVSLQSTTLWMENLMLFYIYSMHRGDILLAETIYEKLIALPEYKKLPFPHSVGINTLYFQTTKEPNTRVTIDFTEYVTPQDLIELKLLLAYNRTTMPAMLQMFFQKTYISLAQGTQVSHVGTLFNMSIYPFTAFPNNASIPETAVEFFNTPRLLPEQFYKVLGRTILLWENPEQNKLTAIKILKKNEDQTALLKQYHTDKYHGTQAQRLNLLGEIPGNGHMIKIDDVPAMLDNLQITAAVRDDLLKMIAMDDNDSSVAYVYTASEKYFTYLSSTSLSIAEFKNSSVIAINDLLNLLREGFIYHQLSDLYHDTATERMYLTVSSPPAGKLSNWQAAVRYPNLRASGLADSGDWCTVEVFNENHMFADIRDYHSRKINEYIGQMLLVVELCGASAVYDRFKNNNYSQAEKDQQWLKLAQALKDVHQFAYNKVAELLGVKMPQRIFTAACDHYAHLAKQMSFWCDSSRHWQYLSQKRLPEGIYEDGCVNDIDSGKATADMEERLYWGEIEEEKGINGCDVKGQHLGLENGLFPLDDRAHYAVSVLPVFLEASLKEKMAHKALLVQYNSTKLRGEGAPYNVRVAAATVIQRHRRFGLLV